MKGNEKRKGRKTEGNKEEEKKKSTREEGDKKASFDKTAGGTAGRNYLQCCLNHLLIFLHPPHLLAC